MTLGDEMSRRRVRTRTAALIACAILALCGGVCVAGSAGAVSLSEPGPLLSGQAFEFKALIDDRQWSVGQNYTGVGGQTIDVYPTFE